MPAEEVHPRCGEPAIIPWLGFEDQRLLARLDEAGIKTTAKALVQDVTNPQVALFARETFGHGLALVPDNWRNQLPVGHRLRPASFESLPYSLAAAYTPDEDAFEGQALAKYAEETLEAEAERHATLLIAPAHVAGVPGTLGREVELRLLEAAVDYAEREGLREPAASDVNETPRVLFALILISAADLTTETVKRLVAQYGSLGVDGFIVHPVGQCESGVRAAAVASLAAGLEAVTRKPAVVQGAGDLYLAYLAAQFSVCTGFAESRKLVFPPPAPPKKDKHGGRPRRLPVLHPEMLHSFAVRSTGSQAERLSRAFDEYRCDCGAHVADLPPQNNCETKNHTLEVALTEWGSLRKAADAERWLVRRCVRATNARRALGVAKPLPRGWHTVVPAARAARAELGTKSAESS